MPAILVEGGFISNPQERALLKDPEYLEKIARGTYAIAPGGQTALAQYADVLTARALVKSQS